MHGHAGTPQTTGAGAHLTAIGWQSVQSGTGPNHAFLTEYGIRELNCLVCVRWLPGTSRGSCSLSDVAHAWQCLTRISLDCVACGAYERLLDIACWCKLWAGIHMAGARMCPADCCRHSSHRARCYWTASRDIHIWSRCSLHNKGTA